MHRTTLVAEYEWYLEQSMNPENPPSVRELWRQLADEIKPRVTALDHDQESLW